MRSMIALTAALGLAACGPATGSSADAGPADGGPTNPRSDAGPACGGDAGLAVTGLTPETWSWVPVAGAVCRDGSPTGFGVSVNPSSDKLVIYLEGGGACFNIVTCAENPSTYGAADFSAFPAGEGSTGLFDRGDPKNPVADWNMVYVPYCTGDIHGGDQPGGNISGVGPQQFVGYENVALDLAKIVPTFAHVSEVLLTGASAGGFGAFLNYDQVAAAFPCASVQMLDDSAPPMSADYLALCLQNQVSQEWNFAATVIADCGPSCAGDGGFALPYLQHVVGGHPDRAFGLVDSVNDLTMRTFYEFGLDDCQGTGSPMPGAQYEAGLLDIRSEMAAYPNFGVFAFPGTDHTSIENQNFDSRTAGDAGFPLTSFMAEITDGGVSNEGP